MSARVSALMGRLGNSAVPAQDHDPDRAPPAVVSRPGGAAANDATPRPALWRHPCGSCTQHHTPGAAWPGYCGGRDDLPLAYGLLHELPTDLGDGCPEYRPRG